MSLVGIYTNRGNTNIIVNPPSHAPVYAGRVIARERE